MPRSFRTMPKSKEWSNANLIRSVLRRQGLKIKTAEAISSLGNKTAFDIMAQSVKCFVNLCF